MTKGKVLGVILLILVVFGGVIWFVIFQGFSPDGVTEENLIVLAEQMLEQNQEPVKVRVDNNAYMVSTKGRVAMLEKLNIAGEDFVRNYKIVSDKRIKFLAEALEEGYVKEETLKVYVVNTCTTKEFETWSCSDGSKILFLISSKEEEIKVSDLGEDYNYVVFFSHLKGKE